MTKLGVVVDGQGNFIEDMLSGWKSRYATSIFSFQDTNFPLAKGRLNPWLRRRALQKFLDDQDVVFFEWAGYNLTVASKLKSKTPLIVRLHSWELFHFAQWVNWDPVKRVILVSQAMRDRFCEFFPDHSSKSIVIPAGKKLDKFQPASRIYQGNIGLLGNLLPIKRVYEMVLTLAELRNRGCNFTLHLGGLPNEEFNNRRYYTSLKSAVQKLGLQDHVIFHGWVSDVSSWLQGMDILVSNSFWEGQPNALIEAMATGCYCLSHFWDGADEILPAEYLYTSESALIRKLIEYADLPEDQKVHHQTYMRAIALDKFDSIDSEKNYQAIIEEVAKTG